jgi:hypothetical protein
LKHLRRAILEEPGKANFFRLAPARMIDRRVDVGVEPVLRRHGELPRTDGLLLDHSDLHDRLDALEAVLPRHDEANRRAILIRQHFVVQAHGQNRERVHRFVHAEAFRVRPSQIRRPEARQLAGIVQRGELDEARSGGRLQLGQ